MVRRTRPPQEALRNDLSRQRPVARETLGDDRRHSEGARLARPGAGGDQPLCRRTRLRYARAYMRRRESRDRSRRDALPASARHSAAARGGRQKIQAGKRPGLQGLGHDRRHRRQAYSVQRVSCDAQPRRRSDRSGALLGELPGDGGDLRGNDRLRRHADGGRLQAAVRGARARHHASGPSGWCSIPRRTLPARPMHSTK